MNKTFSLLTGLLFSAAATAGATWPDLLIHLHKSGKAYLVDPATDTRVATLDTGPGGTLGSTTPDGKKLYVGAAAKGADTVTAIDLEKRQVVASIKTGSRPKHPLASPDGKWVAVNHWGLDGGKLRYSFIDAATDQVARTVDVEVGDPDATKAASMHNAWSADSRYLFGVDRIDNQLVVIDTQDWSVRESGVPSAPHYPVPSPDGKELWLVVEGVDRANRPAVLVYDLTKQGMPQVARIDMPLIGEEVIEGHHGNFTQDGRLFMMLNRGGGKTKIGRELVFIDAAIKRIVRRLTTASNGVGHAYNSPDGRHVIVTNYGNNVVTVVDLFGGINPVEDLEIGAGRMGHAAFTLDGRYAYISNAQDGNLFKLDMGTLQVVQEIATGNGPGGGQVLNVWTNVFEELPRD